MNTKHFLGFIFHPQPSWWSFVKSIRWRILTKQSDSFHIHNYSFSWLCTNLKQASRLCRWDAQIFNASLRAIKALIWQWKREDFAGEEINTVSTVSSLSCMHDSHVLHWGEISCLFSRNMRVWLQPSLTPQASWKTRARHEFHLKGLQLTCVGG